MPASFKDQFYQLDPASPPAFGTAVSFVRLEMVNQNDADNDIDAFDGDSVGGVDITASWPGDTVTVFVAGAGNITYTGTTFYLADGGRVFTPTDGQVLQDGILNASTFVNTQGPLNTDTDLGPTCFTPGTLILTPQGERRVETLVTGDLVMTRDHGAQPLLWTGRNQAPAEGAFAPVHFEAGVLGLHTAMEVSQQHRMLIDDWRAAYFYGYGEVLVAARHLVNGTTVKVRAGGQVEYIHLLLQAHEVIFANGAASESFFPGYALTQSERKTRSEVITMFPELEAASANELTTARPVIRTRDAALLAK